MTFEQLKQKYNLFDKHFFYFSYLHLQVFVRVNIKSQWALPSIAYVGLRHSGEPLYKTVTRMYNGLLQVGLCTTQINSKSDERVLSVPLDRKTVEWLL